MRAMVTKLKVKSLFKSMFVSGLLLVSAQSIADVFTIQVKVTVVEKTCDIYGNSGKNTPITVTFPDLIIRQIGGQYGKTEIPYFLECEDVTDNPALKIKFIGTDAQSVPNSSFKEAGLLKTTDNNLAIKIVDDRNGAQVKLNTWFPFRYNSKPKLMAIPFPSDAGGIRGGEFIATGTLSVEYQ